MSINGNLRDFDISYIYQIISQECKTGRLVLTSDEAEVYVIFNRGKVIFAGDNRQDLPHMLCRYAQTIRKDAEGLIEELARRYKGNFRSFSGELLRQQLVPADDLALFIETSLEDLACNLFFWEQGYYHFDVLQQVGNLQYDGIGLSADAVTMEAARRIDEWKQMRRHILDDTVFIRSPDADKVSDKYAPCPLHQTPDFLLQYIDGTTSVGYLCDTLFISKYRIIDSLNELKEQNRIIALSDKYSRSINAALKRRSIKADESLVSNIYSGLAAAGIVTFIFLLGSLVLRGNVLNEKLIEMRTTEADIIRIQSENKISIASLLYHAQNGTPLTNIKELVKESYIGKRDLPSLGKPVR